MNKLFSKIASLSVGLAMAVGVGVALGHESVKEVKADSVVTFTVNVETGTTSMSKEGVSVTTTSGTFSRTDNYRVYANNSMTVSVASGSITAMSFTISQNTFTADVGTWSDNSWSGDSSSVTLAASGGQVRFTTFSVTVSGGSVTSYTITYDGNGGSGSMANTTNTVAACEFTAPDGKQFSTWNTQADGKGTDYAPGATASADLDLFAIWEEIPTCVTLDNIGATLGSSLNTEMATVDISDGEDTYTLNYYQCKKQVNAMFMAKSVDPFISNHTEMPGKITSVELFINSGAAAAATYDVAFGTSEYTAAASGIGAVNITGGNSHVFENASVADATFFCVTLGSATNGQVLKIVVNYEEGGDPELDTLVVKLNDATESPLSLPWSSTNSWLFYANDKDDNDINANWSSSDENVFTVYKNGNNVAVVTPVNPGTAILTASAEGFNNGTFELTVTSGDLSSIAVSGSMTKTAYTTNDAWDPTGLVVTATYSTGYEAVVASDISWSYNPAAPADGVSSVVATASFGGKSASSSAQAVTVTVAHAGTAEDPFTVVEALAKANEIGAVGTSGQGPWVTKGIISRVTSAPAATYWNATYWISDDGSQTNELQVYRGFYLNGDKFDEETALLLTAGKIVTITGNLTGSYGCEYCQGNYLLSLESPSTGDIDVTFEPETNFEVGTNGSFSASTTATNPTYTWSVEDPSILSVDASTGSFEALAMGVTKVTVNVTATEGNGEASAFITVNGSSLLTVAQANALAATVEDGKTTPYYVHVEGYVSGFDVDSQARAINIKNEAEDSEIMVFVGKSGYSSFIEGLHLGDAIRVKANVQNYSGKYELVSPVKYFEEYVAMSFAYELLELTDAVCKDYDGKTDNHDAIAAIWETLAPKYEGLNDAQKNRCVDPDMYECGETVKGAMARYDYLTGKYGLTNFISGRTPVESHYTPAVALGSDNNSYIIIVVISAVSVMSFGLALFLRKKRSK